MYTSIDTHSHEIVNKPLDDAGGGGGAGDTAATGGGGGGGGIILCLMVPAALEGGGGGGAVIPDLDGGLYDFGAEGIMGEGVAAVERGEGGGGKFGIGEEACGFGTWRVFLV